ncbi:auxilin-like protein 1 isoform X2 [Nymphaea colorata]|uniref:auxilin-like protein 1 isoform X2 n=1 Tax=Nymphaea colorata TaxID=210225 RepID=UPI00214E2ECD|nr:auxilin-like protein 1 isoform X2 [Nymphaea colorata]
MEEVRPSVLRGRHGFRAHSGKKAANGNGFPPTRTVYDDVFGGPPKYTVPSFPPCVDDYAEIFRGPSPAQKTPPVPFLELASDYDGEVALVSGDSYADIFGGFACDFTVSLDELLGRSQATAEMKGFRGDSAKKARYVVDGEKKPLEKVPTKISSIRMDNSDGISTSVSENISVASKSANQQLCGNQMQLDMSPQIINHKSKENAQREMLVSELDAASKSTIVVDPDFSSVETRNTKGSINASSASIVTEKVAEIKLDNIADLKSPKRTLLSDSKDNSLPKMFRHELKKDDLDATLKPCQLEDGPFVNSHVYPSYHDYGVDKYESKDVFLSVTEISLQTQPTELPPPSRPPPMLGIKHDSNKRGISEKRLGTSTSFYENSDLLNGRNSSRQRHAMAASGTFSAEEASKQSSPRFLDVEVDMNSAAAASAAAMKEVMEEAKAKLKLAKEFRERRKNSLKNNKKFTDKKGKKNMEKEETDREEKRNKVQEECDSAQEFFECTLEMTLEVSDCEYKECCQEEHKERRPPKKDSHYPEKQSCLDLDEECAKKSLENGSEVVKESDKNKINEGTHCLEQHRHKEIVEPPLERFELQKTERSFVLVQKCTEEKARKGTSVVSDSRDQKTNRREHQVEEVHICRVSEKMENAAVEICERKQNEKKVESDHSSHGREDGMKKQIMTEHNTGMKAIQTTQEEEVHICRVSEKMENAAVEICERKQNEKKVESDHCSHGREDGMKKQIMGEHDTGMTMKAVQTTQQHMESEKIETDKKYWVGNEVDGKVTATGEIHQQGACSDTLETAQESMNQEKMNLIKQMAAQEPMGLEETWQQEKTEEKFASTLETHEEERSNGLKIAQEFKKEDEVHKKTEKAAQEEETWQQEKIEEKFASTLESHEEECSNRLRTSQEFKKEDVVHKKNEKAAQEAEIQQQDENKEQKIFQEESKGNEREEQRATTREPHEQGGSSHGAVTTQESREQDEVHENKEKVQQQEEEEKLTPDNMVRERNEEEKISARGEIHQDNECSNDLETAEESIKRVEMLKNKKDVAQEEVQLQEEKEEQIKVGQDCQGNEKLEELTTAGKNHKLRERINGLKDVQESRKQEEIQKNKPRATQEAVFQEENISVKANEAADKHKQNEKAFHILVDGDDLDATTKRQNTAQTTPVQEIKEKKVEAAQHVNKLEEKDKILKMSHKINEIQGVEQKMRKFNEIHEKGEKEKSQLEKERLKRDREQEMERLMKLEEEKEREREREKDRIAVERATHEARDKPVADAWDKAEKAAVERATVEAREKAPPEPKVVDRTSAEGKFRTERSAVDKATAEARERAAERAIVEKVAAEARERMERAVAERFAAALRDKQKKDNDREDGTSLRMNGARSTTAEVQNTRDASSSETEKRRKAKFDRYRRTTERAAKALADKKARDILAQREQAERNRLAESLDGDVKRWSTGKEGNLRALLSTLQYILGPENGWQPVPLTEIITSAAVKKAYRKATLCVHPDKVQQRGATVQQKYICEKVFDLLKEAWNKFNSEER